MAGRLQLRTVSQVFDELEALRPDVFELLKKHRATFLIPAKQQWDVRVSEVITTVGDLAPLWEQTGGRKMNPDPADPWLIGVASVYGYTLVTDESDRSPKKIPAVCKMPKINCRCISGPHFLIETKVVQQIDPATIDPGRFFRQQ